MNKFTDIQPKPHFNNRDLLTLDQIITGIIKYRLQLNLGNITKTAKSLGISRNTVKVYLNKPENNL